MRLLRFMGIGLFIVAGCLAAASLAAPVASVVGFRHIARALYHVLASLCHQMPARTLSVLGMSMALCSRNFALQTTLAVGGLTMVRCRRSLPWSVSAALLVPLLVDTLTQSAGWRESTNPLRIVTGILAGFGVAGGICRGVSGSITRAGALGSRSFAGPVAVGLGSVVVAVILVAGRSNVRVQAEAAVPVPGTETPCELLGHAAAEVEPEQRTTGGSSIGLPREPAACLFIPVFAVGGIRAHAKDYRERQRAASVRATEECLAVFGLTEPSPQHPEPAHDLRNLATRHVEIGEQLQRQASEDRYVAGTSGETPLLKRAETREAMVMALWQNAESLYKRAEGLQAGVDNHELATTLEGYAILLRKMKRNTEAAELEARIQAIRAMQRP